MSLGLQHPILRIDEEVSLRPLLPEHAEEVFALVETTRDALRPWMTWIVAVASAAELREGITGWLATDDRVGGRHSCIDYRGQLAGLIYHIHVDRAHDHAEIGYWLAAPYRRRGVMTRALGAFTELSLTELALHRVYLKIAVGNTASRSVARRVGYVEEGVMRHGMRLGADYVDAVFCAKIATADSGVECSSAARVHRQGRCG